MNRAHTAAVTEVNGDDFHVLLFQIMDYLLRNIFMTGAVKTIGADAMLIVKFFWNRHTVSYLRHSLVKSCVEHCYLFGRIKNNYHSPR